MSSAVVSVSTKNGRLLTAAEFHRLADVPPEVEWFANLSDSSTRRAYENAISYPPSDPGRSWPTSSAQARCPSCA